MNEHDSRRLQLWLMRFLSYAGASQLQVFYITSNLFDWMHCEMMSQSSERIRIDVLRSTCFTSFIFNFQI